MTQYIFVLDKPINPKEIIIEATGMMDAINQLKVIQKKFMEESSSKINIRFKGVSYK